MLPKEFRGSIKSLFHLSVRPSVRPPFRPLLVLPNSRQLPVGFQRKFIRTSSIKDGCAHVAYFDFMNFPIVIAPYRIPPLHTSTRILGNLC